MPPREDAITTKPEPLVILDRITDDLDNLKAAINGDLPAIERIDGGYRWRLNAKQRELRMAVERVRRDVAETYAELERVRREGGEELGLDGAGELVIAAFPDDADLIAAEPLLEVARV